MSEGINVANWRSITSAFSVHGGLSEMECISIRSKCMLEFANAGFIWLNCVSI